MQRRGGNPLCRVDPDGSIGEPLTEIALHQEVYALFFTGWLRMTVHQDGERYWGETSPGEDGTMGDFVRSADGYWCCQSFADKRALRRFGV